MSATEHLAAYAEGWTAGDLDTILEALSDGFVILSKQNRSPWSISKLFLMLVLVVTAAILALRI